MPWCDAGVNWLSHQFTDQHQAILTRARECDVRAILCIASDIAEASALQPWLEQPELFATAGIHPHQAKSVTAADWHELQHLLQHEKVVALGECGLDFNRNFSEPAQQLAVFEQQLSLAQTTAKAVYLHERDAFTAMQSCLRNAMPQRAIIHCFTGDEAQLRWYLDNDLYVGITGWICDERRGQLLQQIVRYIPDDRLILETDAPYLLPRDWPYRPKPKQNEPYLLPHIAERVAAHRNTNLEQLQQQVWQNCQRLFNLPQACHD